MTRIVRLSVIWRCRARGTMYAMMASEVRLGFPKQRDALEFAL